MAHVHETAATRIIDWLHRVEDSLVGREITMSNGEVGIVHEIRLDDLHGLCFTFDDPVSGFDEIECGITRRWYPVSTIREVQWTTQQPASC